MYLINHEKIKKNVKFLPSCGSVALGLQEFPKNKPKITNWVEVSLKEISNLNYDSSFISKKTLFALPAGLLRQKIHCFLWWQAQTGEDLDKAEHSGQTS